MANALIQEPETESDARLAMVLTRDVVSVRIAGVSPEGKGWMGRFECPEGTLDRLRTGDSIFLGGEGAYLLLRPVNGSVWLIVSVPDLHISESRLIPLEEFDWMLDRLLSPACLVRMRL